MPLTDWLCSVSHASLARYKSRMVKYHENVYLHIYTSIFDNFRDYDGWLTLMPGVNITNDKALISRVIDQEFERIAGTIEYQHFIEADNIIYCELDAANFKKGEGSNEALYVW
jgi:hypothetical protein